MKTYHSTTYREPQSWIVFTYAGRELVRITAAEATYDEPEDTRALLAFEHGCPSDEISVSIEEV